MKKFYLALALSACVMTAAADVTTFLAADAMSSPVPTAPQGTVVMLPEGDYLHAPVSRVPKQPIPHTFASSSVQLRGLTTGINNVDGKSVSGADSSYVTSGAFRWYNYQQIEFKPAKGLTITRIRLFTQTEAQTKLLKDFETDETNALIQTWEGEADFDEPLVVDGGSGQNRCFWIEVTTSGQSTQVAQPVLSHNTPYLATDNALSFTCATPGATIHYTVDGSEPTEESPIYNAPFTLDDDAVVRAIAVKAGMQNSFPSYNNFSLVPAGCTMASYNFSDWLSLVKADGTSYKATDMKYAGKNISLKWNGTTFINNGTSLHTNSTTTPNANYLYQSATFGGMIEYRTGDNTTITIKAEAANQKIQAVVVAGSILTSLTAGDTEKGTFKANAHNTSLAKWLPVYGQESNSMTLFTPTKNMYIDQIYVFYSETSGVSDVTVSDENAPVEYYNLQGVRVENPEKGLYIKRQGNKAVKVLF